MAFKSKFCRALLRHADISSDRDASHRGLFVCATCQKGFIKVSNFLNHQKLHEIWRYLPEELLKAKRDSMKLKIKGRREQARTTRSVRKAKNHVFREKDIGCRPRRARMGAKPINRRIGTRNHDKILLSSYSVTSRASPINKEGKARIKSKNAKGKYKLTRKAKSTSKHKLMQTSGPGNEVKRTSSRIKWKNEKGKYILRKKAKAEKVREEQEVSVRKPVKSTPSNKRKPNSKPKLKKNAVSSKSKKKEPKVMKCRYCGRCFISQSRLDDHIKIHDSEQCPFACEDCSEHFETEIQLKKHEQETHPDLNEDDSIPKTSMKKKKIHPLARQKQNGMGQRGTYICEVCSKEFNKKSSLFSHKIVHEERPFSCKTCSQKFRKQQHLERHLMDIHNKESSFKCETCGKNFTLWRNLKRHLKNHDSVGQDEKHVCEICSKEFGKKSWLITHKVVHEELPFSCQKCSHKSRKQQHLEKHMMCAHNARNKDGSFECQTCGKSFAVKGNFTRHNKMHIEERQYICAKCGKSFRTVSNFKDHVVRHDEERPFECDICHKFFKTKGDVRTHRAIHRKPSDTEVKEIPCDICGKIFHNKKQLCIHKLNVHKSKQFPCEICGKVLLYRRSLKLHVAVHKGEDLYTCDVCGRKFPRREEFQRHMSIHSGEKRYSCSVCSETFIRKYNLKKHEYKHTNEPMPYQCDKCERSYFLLSELNKHKVKTHNDVLPGVNVNTNHVCTTCGKTYKDKRDLWRHEFEHTGNKPFSCDICSKSFTRKLYFVEHQRNHSGEKPFVCKTCSKSFTSSRYLAQHLITHEKVKKLSCSFCERTFSVRRSLESHEKNHHKEGEKSSRNAEPKKSRNVKIKSCDEKRSKQTESDTLSASKENANAITETDSQIENETQIAPNMLEKDPETSRGETENTIIAISSASTSPFAEAVASNSQESIKSADTILTDRVERIMQQSVPVNFSLNYQAPSPLQILAADLNLVDTL